MRIVLSTEPLKAAMTEEINNVRIVPQFRPSVDKNALKPGVFFANSLKAFLLPLQTILCVLKK